jgi:hypothetical protein
MDATQHVKCSLWILLKIAEIVTVRYIKMIDTPC